MNGAFFKYSVAVVLCMSVTDEQGNPIAEGDDVLYHGQGVWEVREVHDSGKLYLYNPHRDRYTRADPSQVLLYHEPE